MTFNTREYHRTFNILRPLGRMPSGAELVRNSDRELKEARAKYPRVPDQQALELLWADKLRTQKPLPDHEAFEDIGGQYKPVRIEEKRDQNFEKFATRWERFWSRLVMYWDSRLTPVVDSSGLVVAYVGNVRGDHLLRDGNPFWPREVPWNDSVAILKYFRLFVGTKEFFGRTDLSFLDSSISYTVVTDIDGEVMWFKFGSRKDDSIQSVSLLDILGTIALARAALGLAVSLGKYGVRTLTRRPPVAVPAMAASNTLTGMAVSTRGMLPAQTMGRRTIIMGDDMAKFTPYLKTNFPEHGFYDIVIHGDPTSFYILENGVWKTVSARDVANLVRPYLRPGDQIRLLACESASTGGPAQQLTNELKQHTVWAPSKSVYPVHGAPIKDANGKVLRFTSHKSFIPDGGKFFQFDPPGGSAILSGPGRQVNQHVIKRTK